MHVFLVHEVKRLARLDTQFSHSGLCDFAMIFTCWNAVLSSMVLIIT